VPPSTVVGSDTCSGARGLEQPYRVAGRILDQDLVPAPVEDFAAEARANRTQHRDLAL
jgi:hypothetical protein